MTAPYAPVSSNRQARRANAGSERFLANVSLLQIAPTTEHGPTGATASVGETERCRAKRHTSPADQVIHCRIQHDKRFRWRSV
jgi:hypothetical protein